MPKKIASSESGSDKESKEPKQLQNTPTKRSERLRIKSEKGIQLFGHCDKEFIYDIHDNVQHTAEFGGFGKDKIVVENPDL